MSSTTSDSSEHSRSRERRMYGRFALMILTSSTVMFVLTYSNSYEFGHMRWSEERF